MLRWLKELDELLRGNKTTPELLSAGTRHLKLGPHAAALVALGIVYGLCMGLFSVLSRTPPVYQQLLSSAVKVPLLFLVTLVVTFPSLYVFSTLLGTKLGTLDFLRIIMAAVAVNLAVLASFAPITAFFTLTTTSYDFMKLLNIFFFVVSGAIGLGILIRMLRRLEQSQGGVVIEGVRPKQDPTARRVSKVWLILYVLVQIQAAWVLRPFIGGPDQPFAWFRERGGSAFLDFTQTLGRFFGAE